MRGKQNRTFACNFFNQMSNFNNLIRVQSISRFIQHHQCRLMDNRLSNPHSLLVSPRKMTKHSLTKMCDSTLFFYPFHRIVNIFLGYSSQSRTKSQIFIHILISIQRRCLRQKSYILFCFDRIFRKIHAINKNFSTGWTQHPTNNIHCCRFARPI